MKKLAVTVAFIGLCAGVVFLQYLATHPEEVDAILGTEEQSYPLTMGLPQEIEDPVQMAECTEETREATPEEIRQLGWSACTATICGGSKWKFHIGGQVCTHYQLDCGSDPRGCP
jgi:hypothetical protein